MTNTNTDTAEAVLLGLSKDLAEQVGNNYASVKLEAYADGTLKWTCYTAATRHTDGPTFEAALAGQFDHVATAATMRAQAAELLDKAAALDAQEDAQ